MIIEGLFINFFFCKGFFDEQNEKITRGPIDRLNKMEVFL